MPTIMSEKEAMMEDALSAYDFHITHKFQKCPDCNTFMSVTNKDDFILYKATILDYYEEYSYLLGIKCPNCDNEFLIKPFPPYMNRSICFSYEEVLD